MSKLTGKKLKDLQRDVLCRDRCRCVICNRYGAFPPHHIIYRSQGGYDSIDNLATLCMVCHRQIHELNGWAAGMGKRDAADYLREKIGA